MHLQEQQQQQQHQQHHQVLGNLQQQHQMQQQQVLENLQHLQAELLQPQLHPGPPSQGQAGELLTIQTSFPQQPPSHTSPPQQLFQSPQPRAETPSPQDALLHSTLTVLTGGGLSSEERSPCPALFLSPNPLSSAGLSAPGGEQQLAFLSSMDTSAAVAPPRGVFQGRAQLSPMGQQHGTPMDQQQSPQQTQQLAQQGSLFQGSALAPPQQTGLLLCAAALPSALLFSQGQGGRNTLPQDPSSLLFSQPGVEGGPQPDPAEPMSFQEQSSSGAHPGSGEAPPRQALFQEQQPMQVGSGTGGGAAGGQQVELFLPQGSLSGLQGAMGSQELGAQTQAPASTTIFVVQGGVGMVGLQTASSAPSQGPPEQLFQTGVSGNMAAQGQPNLFVFGIQNDSSQLLSASSAALSSPGQQQNPAHLLAQTASPMDTNLHSTMQTALQSSVQTPMQTGLQATLEGSLATPMQTQSLTESQTMEKIQDLLESLQDQ